MTFPTIPTVAAGRVLFTNQADTSGTRTFPSLSSLTKNSGDLLIAIITTYQSSTNPQFSSWGGGFTECSDQGTSSTLGIGVAYKWSTGSETGTFTVTQAATITGHASMCLLSIPLAHPTTPIECGTIANGTSAAADPGAFNPAGWGTEDTLWIAVDANGMTSGTGAWAACGAGTLTNYTDLANSNTIDSSTVGQTEIAVAFRQVNAASEDRGAVSTHDLSNARNSALIIAVRPAPVTHATTGTITGPGAAVDGAASSATARPSSGALTGPGAAIDGSAARFRAHSVTGVLTGSGAIVAGAAERSDPGFVTHDTTGTIIGVGAAVDGAASSATARSSSGALTGAGSVVTGSAARYRAHASSGVLSGPGALVVGTSARTGAPVVHAASGALTGTGAVISGASAHVTHHSTAGALTGPGSALAGTAAGSVIAEPAPPTVGAGIGYVVGSGHRPRRPQRRPPAVIALEPREEAEALLVTGLI